MRLRLLNGNGEASAARPPSIRAVPSIRKDPGRLDLLDRLAQLVQLGLQDKEELLKVLNERAQVDLLALLGP